MDSLDVRPFAPAVRHSTIFEHFDALKTGDTLRLVNDHDPAPLRYQLEATRPGHFCWEAVESGPEQWSVDITSTARTIDVRPIIASGEKPFDAIMAEVDALGEGEVLVVLAPFEPTHLEETLAERSFTHRADQLDGGDFCVTFARA